MSMNQCFRILIIDDNPEIHRDFIKILTKNSSEDQDLESFENAIFGEPETKKNSLSNFQIDTASQGQEGVECIAKAMKENYPYALAFVDIRMPPGWDGIETIKHIWELDKDIQIVICTAYSDYTWEETVENLGQKENLLILKKPFDTVAVRQLSCALTKKWQLLQESREYTSSLEKRVNERTTLLQKSLSISRGTLESSADGILVLDNDYNIIDYNQKLMEMLKVSQSILDANNGRTLLEYISQQFAHPEAFESMINAPEKSLAQEKSNYLKSKDQRIFETYAQPYMLGDKIEGRIWSFRDITRRAMLEEQLQHQATHDALTGLPNRVLLTDRIHQLLIQAQRETLRFCILFFDLDHFKLVNDSLSHSIGDELLQVVAKRIRSTLRDQDTLARLGGDEFVALMVVENENVIAGIATKILNAFHTRFKLHEHQVSASTSIGVAVFPQDGLTIDELLRNADAAMYRAKENGGNQFQFYTEELGKKNIERLENEAALRRAIEKREFFLCYQPQFVLKTGSVSSVEALLRWQHPVKGVILPMEIIPLAIETGLIIPIGEWVIHQACLDNKHWQGLGLPKVRVSVNLAAQQLKQPNFVKTVKNILAETKLEPEYLEFEMTENVIISCAELIDVMNELKALGINLAIDNFGSGYSSLNYLRKFPIDRLKIERDYFGTENEDGGNDVMMQAILSMAKTMNFEVLAEGIETKTQVDYLKSKKWSEVQGIYFSKPLLSPELEKVLEDPKVLQLFQNDDPISSERVDDVDPQGD